ncbi:SEN1 N terminal-domain-containing protein [Sparassis latifolia]
MASSSPDNEKVKAEVTKLRDNPTNLPSEAVLALVCNYLIGPPQRPPEPRNVFEHWFCSRADDLTVQVATFLIRLHAYHSARVEVWRQQLRACLAQCCDCVRGLQEKKVSSRHTYFGAFSEETLRGFYDDFNQWELKIVLSGLAEVKILPDPVQPPRRTLSDAPAAIVYHMFSNLRIFQDTRILSVIHSHVPSTPISSWPADIPPPGLIFLRVDKMPEARRWAEQQLTMYKASPMAVKHFLPTYITVLATVIEAVMSGPPFSAVDGKNLSLQLAQDPDILWSGFPTILRFVPVEYLRFSQSMLFDLRHVVAGHIHDTGSHFVNVLKCFLLILTRMGPAMWEGETTEYPQMIFTSIKDNTRYLDALQSLETTRRDNWLFSWIETYLKTIGKLPIIKEVLPTIMQFLCEELQHERFQQVRPVAMTIAARIMFEVSSQSEKEGSCCHEDVVRAIMDIHASVFVSVAFARAYGDDSWAEARTQTRKAIKLILEKDVKNVLIAVSYLCGLSEQPVTLSPPTVREQVWRGMYENIQPGDSGGIAMMVSILAEIAHIDELKESALADRIANSGRAEAFRGAFTSVNHALSVICTGFGEAISRYLDLSMPSIIADLFRRTEVVKKVMILMFSPVEAIREPAQSLAGLAFDVEVRLDCFRALLERYPNAAMGGLMEFLRTYVRFANVSPEACSLSKALARCLTDIIDLLCSSPDGLLLKEDFLKSGVGSTLPAQLPEWWNLMTQALSVIFSKTPKWAIYFDNVDMILWMRDALIFGRDMLAQRRIIETGTLIQTRQAFQSGDRKLSRVGKCMVDNLQQVLSELARWLRLTDEELLHQSFALLESLLACFEETGVRPLPSTLQKLQKHIDDARKKDPKRPQTKLDTSRLARLQDAISSFDEEDEVQIISHKLPESKVPPIPSKHGAAEVKGRAASGQSIVRKPVIESSKPRPPVIRRPSAKPSVSSYYTAEDQKKLDSDISLPRLSRSKRPDGISPATSGHPHATSKRDIMPTRAAASVSPSSSENDESDDGGAGLASLSKLQKTPTIKKPAERRQVMLLDMPTHRQNHALERINKREDARRTQLRLKPDISSLHRTLLSWDYDNDGPDPPGEKLKLAPVPPRFTDPQHFRRIFEPMLLLECWTQLVESKTEPCDKYECRIASRQFIDDWLDMDITINENVGKDFKLSDADIVLLRHPGTRRCILGKVQSYRATSLGIQATVRCCTRNKDPGLQINTIWLLSKALSLATLHREYAALLALPCYDLCGAILHAEVSMPRVIDAKEVQRTMTEYKVNEPQARAILNSLQVEGFALIQGPPGTGKTSTICGLVHAFLSRRPKPATAIHAGTNASSADKEPVKKILLCAPSNAAINEIANRLKEGVCGAGQRAVCPKVVRVGTISSMISIKDISLEYLMDQKLNASQDGQNFMKDAGGEMVHLRAELESVKHLRQQKLEDMTAIHDNTAKTFALEEEVKKLNKQKMALIHQLDKLKDKQKSDSRTLDATRRRFRTEVLLEADVICSTLSGAAYEYLEELDFELVIIDEAAQAIELSSLIPLKYRCSRCIMVGDPQQLPPTVKSQEACKFGYNQSLFVRLQQRHPEAVNLLSIQYRMHPDISQLPSRLFYDRRLQDGPDMGTKTKRPWHSHTKLGTYRFFNVSQGRQEDGQGAGHSLINRAECQVAVALYNRLRHDCSSFDFDFKVGVISMYRGQIIELRRAFEQRFGADISGTVDFNTVDGFQGQEKDVIILSCVRAGPSVQSVGFLRDIRRMNVALTRAKSSLFVLGHAPTLERSDDMWRNIVEDARARSCLVEVDVAYFTSPATTQTPPSSPKAVKPQSKIEMSIPPGLHTPRELKSLINREAARSPKEPLGETEGTTSPTLKKGQKRPAADQEMELDKPAAASLPTQPPQDRPAPRPKLPPAKRPKPQPSLFIPKKRPVPEGGESGPNGSKRRH